MQKRKIGAVTTGAGAGGGVGYALSQILIHAFPSLEPVEVPIVILIGAVMLLAGGWLVPPQHQELWQQIMDLPQDVSDDDLDMDEADALTTVMNGELDDDDGPAHAAESDTDLQDWDQDKPVED